MTSATCWIQNFHHADSNMSSTFVTLFCISTLNPNSSGLETPTLLQFKWRASCLRSPGSGLDPHPTWMRTAWSIGLDWTHPGWTHSRTQHCHWWCRWSPQTPQSFLHFCLRLRGSISLPTHCGWKEWNLRVRSRTTGRSWMQEWGHWQLGLDSQECCTLLSCWLLHSCSSCTIIGIPLSERSVDVN